MTLGVGYLLAGSALLLAVVLPNLLTRWALSAPIVLVVVGYLIGLLPFGEKVRVSPVTHPVLTTHLAEFTVLIALMGAALALDRPLRWRSLTSWRSWRATWRLLGIAMPLCILATAALGWWALGLTPAGALLLGAALAPTDPVLAADVRVEGPTLEEGEHVDEKDEVRFALTSEAGLNDGLAFPFVSAALLLAAGKPASDWLVSWLAWDVVGKIALGVVVGVLVGYLLGNLAFRSPVRSLRLAHQSEPLLALAVMLLAYGLAEVLDTWGFVAVFCSGIALRASERHHEYHGMMHATMERLELLFTLLLLLMLGIALSDGLLDALTWRGALVGIALLLVIRPVVAWLSLGRGPSIDRADDGQLGPRERMTVAFFGVRGIGSIYYASYALEHNDFDGKTTTLWAVIGFTIVASVLLHGVAATPVMRWLDRVRIDPSVAARALRR